MPTSHIFDYDNLIQVDRFIAILRIMPPQLTKERALAVNMSEKQIDVRTNIIFINEIIKKLKIVSGRRKFLPAIVA